MNDYAQEKRYEATVMIPNDVLESLMALEDWEHVLWSYLVQQFAEEMDKFLTEYANEKFGPLA